MFSIFWYLHFIVNLKNIIRKTRLYAYFAYCQAQPWSWWCTLKSYQNRFWGAFFNQKIQWNFHVGCQILCWNCSYRRDYLIGEKKTLHTTNFNYFFVSKRMEILQEKVMESNVHSNLSNVFFKQEKLFTLVYYYYLLHTTNT